MNPSQCPLVVMSLGLFFVKDASCCKLSNGTVFEECCVSCKSTEVKGTLTNAV